MSISFNRYGFNLAVMEGKISPIYDYCFTDVLKNEWCCDDCIADCLDCPLETEILEEELCKDSSFV